MPINSKQKGKVGERRFRDVLRSHGFCNARRGVQYAGGLDSPDVVCPELPGVHWEVKFTERSNIYDWMQQAIEDAGTLIPIVAHKRKRKDWLAIIKADDLIKLLKKAYGLD